METTLDNTTKVNVKSTDYTVIFNQVGDDRFEVTVPEFGLFDNSFPSMPKNWSSDWRRVGSPLI